MAASPRADRPFIRFNCASLTPELAEAELIDNWKLPEWETLLADDASLEIIRGRHPLLLIRRREEGTGAVVPLECRLDGERRIMVITGPNAGGKTIALKTAGISESDRLVWLSRNAGRKDIITSGYDLTIAEIDPLRVEVFVPTIYYGQIALGDVGHVRPEEPVGGEHDAKVTVVDKVMDAASGTFGVRLLLANPDLALPAGLKCKIRFDGPRQGAARAP